MVLPNNIIDRIDREKLTKTEDLHKEIGKLEHLIYKKNSEVKKNKQNMKRITKNKPENTLKNL